MEGGRGGHVPCGAGGTCDFAIRGNDMWRGGGGGDK